MNSVEHGMSPHARSAGPETTTRQASEKARRFRMAGVSIGGSAQRHIWCEKVPPGVCRRIAERELCPTHKRTEPSTNSATWLVNRI